MNVAEKSDHARDSETEDFVNQTSEEFYEYQSKLENVEEYLASAFEQLDAGDDLKVYISVALYEVRKKMKEEY